jgi:3-oxoacyl-[acyl-carrier-protein] synthase III
MQSIGAYVPKTVLTNGDLESMVNTSDEWIQKRTGIKTRYIASSEESTSDMGYQAALQAMGRAHVSAEEIDLVLCGTISPDFFCMPSTACVIAHKLGMSSVPAFDVSAACSGFIYLIATAKAYIESGMAKTILVIGAEKLSSITDFEDRTTCVLFGDGAGAAIIGQTQEKECAILDVNLGSNGKYQDFLITPGGGSRFPTTQETLDKRMHFMKMKGNETFKIAVRTLANDCHEILERNNISPRSVRYFIPHQANYRIIKAVGDLIELDEEQIVITVDKYGNTSSASIPMAMNDLYESEKLNEGDLLLLDAFGGGLTWGSALLHFNGK